MAIRREHGRRKADRSPLAYKGVDPISPFQFFVYAKAPTSDDYISFNVGDIWFDESVDNLWMLVQKTQDAATWRELGLIPFSATKFPTDSGTAEQVGGEVNLFGSGVISTTGSGNTATVGIPGGTDGQLLIGGGSAAAWANLTSSGGTVSITEGSNSINLEATGTGGVTFLSADVGTAVPDGANAITITGDSNVNTSAAAATLTINLNNSVSIPGPLTLTPLSAGVMQTNASGVVTSNNGTDGQVLIGGGTAPAWANITSTGATIVITNGPNSIDLSYAGGSGGSAFLAYQDGDANNVTGDGTGPPGTATTYTLGTTTAFATVFDTGSDISVGGGGSPVTFTVPATGKYHLMIQVYHEYDGLYDTGGPGADLFYPYEMEIITTARTFSTDHMIVKGVSGGAAPLIAEKDTAFMSIVADMTAGDTATYTIRIDLDTSGVKKENIVGGTSAILKTWISGFQIA